MASRLESLTTRALCYLCYPEIITSSLSLLIFKAIESLNYNNHTSMPLCIKYARTNNKAKQILLSKLICYDLGSRDNHTWHVSCMMISITSIHLATCSPSMVHAHLYLWPLAAVNSASSPSLSFTKIYMA